MRRAAGADPPRTPVMADVARLAGVSLQTVSRVVNGSERLRPETRERVENAIRELGYRPNRAARALVTRRTGTIGVVTSRSGFWGPGTTARSILAAGREAGFNVSTTSIEEDSRAEMDAAIEHLRSQGAEGIVLIEADDITVDAAARLEEQGVPVVVVEGEVERVHRWVGVDQVHGARLATSHLLDLGHTAVAHLAGPATWAQARRRRVGWAERLREAGLPCEAVAEGDWSARSGYEQGLRLLTDHAVTAVFCSNDHMTIGLLRAAAELRLEVPADLGIVGFDDIPEAAYLCPPLTTVAQDFPAVGRLAIATMQAALAGADEPIPMSTPRLVVRDSTAPPRR